MRPVVIELENMEFHAFHGCYELEKKVGNRFSVDLHIEADLQYAATNDDLAASINYLSVYEKVREEMAVVSDILENVADRICRRIISSFPQTLCVSAKVSKIAPPLGGKVSRVSVTVTRRP